MKNSISGKLLETLCYIALNRNYFTNISNSKKGNRISLERRQLFKHKAGAREGGAQFGKVDGGKKRKTTRGSSGGRRATFTPGGTALSRIETPALSKLTGMDVQQHRASQFLSSSLDFLPRR